jgi:glycosyltransferase involved in cell wall biosynthesis
MVIAVNTRTLQVDDAGIAFFIQTFIALAAARPQQHFVFITCGQPAIPIPAAPNISIKDIPQNSKHPLLWKLWYNYKLPATIKKINAAIVFHPNIACSLRCTIPQYVYSPVIVKAQPWLSKACNRFVLSGLPAFLNKATAVLVPGEAAQQTIARAYPAHAGKIKIIPPYTLPVPHLPTQEEKENTRNTYTCGKEYFLFTGPLHEGSNLIHLLKAFSVFKKRQKSGMQLVIAAMPAGGTNSFTQTLATYKYRQDVQLLDATDTALRLQLIAAAYAFVYPVLFDEGAPTLLQAMQLAVPVITSANPVWQSLLQDTVLYCNPADVNSIAQYMMLLYKDEDGRARLVQAARMHSAAFMPAGTLNALGQLLEK